MKMRNRTRNIKPQFSRSTVENRKLRKEKKKNKVKKSKQKPNKIEVQF
jgi:hypothetical protein